MAWQLEQDGIWKGGRLHQARWGRVEIQFPTASYFGQPREDGAKPSTKSVWPELRPFAIATSIALKRLPKIDRARRRYRWSRGRSACRQARVQEAWLHLPVGQ